MRNFALIFLLLLLNTFEARAQAGKASYLFYSADGQQFTVLLSGITQNDEPMSKFLLVRVPKEALQLQAKVIFADESLGEVKAALAYRSDRFLIYEVKAFPKAAIIQRDSILSAELGLSEVKIISYRGPTAQEPGDSSEIVTSVILRASGSDSLNLHIEPMPSGAVNLEMEPGIIDYAGPTGCTFPMGDGAFALISDAVSRTQGDEARLNQLKSLVSGKCLRSDQCQSLLKQFTSERVRLDAAKIMYPVLWDRANVMLFKDSLPSAANWAAFMDYINTYEER